MFLCLLLNHGVRSANFTYRPRYVVTMALSPFLSPLGEKETHVHKEWFRHFFPFSCQSFVLEISVQTISPRAPNKISFAHDLSNVDENGPSSWHYSMSLFSSIAQLVRASTPLLLGCRMIVICHMRREEKNGSIEKYSVVLSPGLVDSVLIHS